jgi:hypothetical protein
MFDQISNQDLAEQELPPPDADWWQIWEFALTFDGYDHWGSFDQCADIGNRWAALYAEQQVLPESLTELRTCLFFEQRRWHHFGDNPDEESEEYIRALLEGIRRRVLVGEIE